MTIKTMLICGLSMVAVHLVYADADDIEKHYTQVKATIVDVDTDCFVRARKASFVDDQTGDLAYMDCEIAHVAATRHGYREKDVGMRATVHYEYRSPVDGQRYSGAFSRLDDVDGYFGGRMIQVFAHKTVPDVSRTTRGDLFVDDRRI